MPDSRGNYSLIINVLIVGIFLCLAIIGAYLIFSVPVNNPGGFESSRMYGYGSALYFDGMPAEGPVKPHYVQNGSLAGMLHFETTGDVQVDDSFLIMAMVDYNLTALYYNGSLSTTHRTHYRTPVSFNTSFQLTGLPEVFHDMVFFIILDPFHEAAGPGDDYLRGEGNGMRFNVIAGNATKPEVLYGAGPLEAYVAYRNRTSNNVLSFGPWLTREPFAEKITASGAPSVKEITSMDVSPGQEISYFINVKNGLGPTNERYGRFVITQLLDYRQIPFRPDVPGYQYYGALDPDRLMALNVSIKAPDTPGTHILSIVSARYPYAAKNETEEFLSADMTMVILNVK